MRLVTVVGVGALGSHVVQFLRNEEITLRSVDFDRVETKNTQSQFHGKPHVNKLKVESLKQTMNFLFGTKIESRSAKLVENNAHELLAGSALVIDCLDNAKARRVVQAYVRTHALPCLHGALDAAGSFGRVIWDESFQIDDETVGDATCEGGEHLPFIAIVAAHIARVAQVFLSSGKMMNFQVNPAGSQRL